VNRLAGLGRCVFAATLIALGVWGLIHGDFAPIWTPVPSHWPMREALAYACAVVAAAGGAGLIWRRTVALAGGVLALWLAGWMLAIKVPAIVGAPLMAAAWESCGETATIVAAAWMLFASAATPQGPLAAVAGPRGQRLARWLYGAALLAFGAAHLAYVKETASLVPAWLPDPVVWVWITGLAYIAAGGAMLSGIGAQLAGVLAALQVGAFTLLIWAPAIAAPGAGADVWSEAAISWTLTASAWVIAERLRRRPA
jgi:uncharacterized membrane protein